MMRGTVPWFLASLVLFAVSSARGAAPEGQPDPAAQTAAETAARRAQQHFVAEQWDAAIDALIEAYAYNPDPDYLYARAQAERMRGNCREAMTLYRRFIESEPSELQLEDTIVNIRRCEEALRTDEAATSADPSPPSPVETTALPVETAAPPAVEKTVEGATPPPHNTQEALRRDPLAATLLATSVAALASGSTVWVVGARRRKAAPGSATEGDYEDQASRGRVRTASGIALVGVGVALAAGAAIRYGLLARRHRAAFNVALMPGSLTFAGIVRF